jgi:hypothetical protein
MGLAVWLWPSMRKHAAGPSIFDDDVEDDGA